MTESGSQFEEDDRSGGVTIVTSDLSIQAVADSLQVRSRPSREHTGGKLTDSSKPRTR